VTETSPCTLEEKRAALEHALTSKTFSRAEQLRAFLSFVCEAEIEGRAADITEYVIGVKVLGRRPEDYSPAEDSSVRTRAYELRQKLEKLYAIELPHEPVHIVIAKGAYTPQYVRLEGDHPVEPVATIPVAHPSLEALPSAGERSKPRWRALTLLAVGAVCGSALTVALFRSPTAASAANPMVREAWGPLARPDSNVVLCAATPLNLTVGPEGHEAYGSSTYPAPPEAYPLFRRHRPLAAGSKLGLIFTDNVLGVGTMNRGHRRQYVEVPGSVLRDPRVATLSALRGRNAMLFGAPVDSEAITRLTDSVPLTVDFEPSVKEFVIRDRSNGTMIVPQKDSQGDFVDVYGLVTVLNTRESDRGRLGMVIFSGITSAGTQGAAEFFASARSLRRLRSVFAREGITGFPAAYQVVIKCTFNNMLLVAYEYRLHKVLQKE
jgi:hypothetical protein